MELYDLCMRVNAEIERRHAGDAMGLVRAKGELAKSTGFLVGLVTPRDPDDPEKIKRLREAATGMGLFA
ncbi:MAG: hypothetical protein JXP72_00795 [Coriobacteriia bacterium]|nr:hypothetical protein [Coriobacteriia bacterium]